MIKKICFSTNTRFWKHPNSHQSS